MLNKSISVEKRCSSSSSSSFGRLLFYDVRKSTPPPSPHPLSGMLVSECYERYQSMTHSWVRVKLALSTRNVSLYLLLGMHAVYSPLSLVFLTTSRICSSIMRRKYWSMWFIISFVYILFTFTKLIQITITIIIIITKTITNRAPWAPILRERELRRLCQALGCGRVEFRTEAKCDNCDRFLSAHCAYQTIPNWERERAKQKSERARER